MALSKLPPETLTQILEALAEIDFLTFLTSQAVSRQFHAIIQSILSVPTAAANSDPAQLAILPALKAKFFSLFDSHECFEKNSGEKDQPLLGDNIARPFQQLPWAETAARRAPYLRPEASWRHLRLTRGRHTITRLDLCKIMTFYGGTAMQYFQVELPPSGLTFGILYDLLLSPDATFGSRTRRWRLLLGKLLNYDDWSRVVRSRYPSEDQFMQAFTDDEDGLHSAVLLVQGFQGCTISINPEGRGDNQNENVWYPKIIGEKPPECFLWHGSVIPKEGLPR